MKANKRPLRTYLFAILFLTTLLMTGTTAVAQKGGGKGKPDGGGDDSDGTALSGTIYLTNGSTIGVLPADGSAAPTAITVGRSDDVFWFEPSLHLHGAAEVEQDRWFAGVSNGSIFIGDRYGHQYLVPGPQLAPYDGRPYTMVRWISDGMTDVGLSWFGVVEDSDGPPLPALYVADIYWDSYGLPAISTAVKVFDIPVFVGEDSDGTITYRYDTGGHAWSPDGSTVAVSTTFDQQHTNVYLWNNPTDGFSLLALDAWTPEWSPVTGIPRIVYDTPDGIYSIDVNGTDEHLHASPGGGKNFQGVLNPHWAPNGQHIIYDDFEFTNKGYSYDIYVVPTGGGRGQNLSDSFANVEGIAWR